MIFLQATSAFAQGAPLALTLDEYTRRAMQSGVLGKETEWTLEQAGYARAVVMRQTAFPTLSAGYDHHREENKDNVLGTDALTETNVANLKLNEQTPLGTTLNIVSNYGDSTPPGQAGRPSISAAVQQPLYLFVKNNVLRQRHLADLAFANAKSNYGISELSIRTQARTNYYNVIQGEELVKLEERQVASVQKVLDVTSALVDAGRSAPVEVMRSKINLQVEQTNLDNAIAQRDQAVLNAKNYILLPLNKDVQFITELEFAPFQIPLRRLIDYALLHQPQLEVLRHQREEQRLLYDASREPTLPTFSLNGGYNENQYQTYVLTHEWDWTASANWLFFDSFVTDAQVRSARIGIWVADLNLENGERTAEVNVRTSYIDVKNTEKQIQYLKFSIDQARRNVDVERLRFQNGVAQLTDVFDSQNSLRNLENEYLGLLVKFNESKDALSQLIGADVDTVQ